MSALQIPTLTYGFSAASSHSPISALIAAAIVPLLLRNFLGKVHCFCRAFTSSRKLSRLLEFALCLFWLVKTGLFGLQVKELAN